MPPSQELTFVGSFLALLNFLAAEGHGEGMGEEPRAWLKNSVVFPPMPAPRFHPLARLILSVAGIVLAQVILVLVVQAAVSTAASLNHRASGPLLDDFVGSHALLLSVLACPPMLIWLYFCRKAFDRRSFVSLGLRVRRCVRDSLLGVWCGATAIALLFGLLYLLAGAAYGHLPIISWSPDAFATAPIITLAMLLLYAGAFCVLGFMEEISFRGYGLHNLVAWIGTRNAIFAQAGIFALVHLPNVLQQTDVTHASSAGLGHALWDMRWGIINIALIGVFFALGYLKTGSLWFPIGFHVSWNFFQGCVFSFPVSGIDVYHLLDIKEVTDVQSALLTGGTFGGEGSILLAPIICAMIYVLWHQPDHPQALLDLALLPQTKPEYQPVTAPAQNLAADSETSPYAAIKTTLRGNKNGPSQSAHEADNVPLSFGVLPRSAPLEPPPIVTVAMAAEAALPAPVIVEPLVVQSPAPPVATVNPPVTVKPAPAPPPTPKAPTGKPPAPRW